MPEVVGQAKLRELLKDLAHGGLIPQAAAGLAAGADRTEARLRATVLKEIPAFQATGNPDVLPALAQHVRAHLDEIKHLFEGREPDDLAFVREHARLRAEQRFPLEATLHAYRCGHRVLSQWLREAALATRPQQIEKTSTLVADFAIEYTNLISVVAAAEYVARTRLIAEAEGDQRTELLSVLLQGFDEADGRVTQLLKRAGYLAQRQAYCIAAIQPVHPAEMDHPDRAHRIIAAVTQAMSDTSIRVLAGVRHNLVAVVMSDLRRQSGWTAARSDLGERVRPLLQVLGTSVVVGVSADHPSTAFLPKAFSEARTALEFADVTNRVVNFSALPIRSILIHRGADAVRATPPAWVTRFIAADEAISGSLSQTLRAFARSHMNMQKAARQLGRHPNTLYARFERIRSLTGLDGQHYDDLAELLLAADCWRL